MSKLGTSRSSLTDGLEIAPKGGSGSKGASGSGMDTMQLVKIGVIVVCFLGVGYVVYSQFFASPPAPAQTAEVKPRPANAKPSIRSRVSRPPEGAENPGSN